VKSKLGYLLSGPFPEVENTLSVSYMFNVVTAPPNATDLVRFWKLISMGILEDDTEKSSSGILNA
jgi:hypothetical protein